MSTQACLEQQLTKRRLDRFSLHPDRTPQSPAQRAHPVMSCRPGQGHGPIASPTTARCRSWNLAVRAVSLPHTKGKHDGLRSLRRRSSLLGRHMPRNARKRVAVPLRRPRTPQVMLRHRLLLPHARLVRYRLDLDQALP
jgi:hypothetical protein